MGARRGSGSGRAGNTPFHGWDDLSAQRAGAELGIAGEVLALGVNARDFARGDRVMGGVELAVGRSWYSSPKPNTPATCFCARPVAAQWSSGKTRHSLLGNSQLRQGMRRHHENW